MSVSPRKIAKSNIEVKTYKKKKRILKKERRRQLAFEKRRKQQILNISTSNRVTERNSSGKKQCPFLMQLLLKG
jgi:hypothetical protein